MSRVIYPSSQMVSLKTVLKTIDERKILFLSCIREKHKGIRRQHNLLKRREGPITRAKRLRKQETNFSRNLDERKITISPECHRFAITRKHLQVGKGSMFP